MLYGCMLMYFNIVMQVWNARRVAKMNMMDDGFDEKVKDRKKQKLKTLAAKGLLNKTRRKKRARTEKAFA